MSLGGLGKLPIIAVFRHQNLSGIGTSEWYDRVKHCPCDAKCNRANKLKCWQALFKGGQSQCVLNLVALVWGYTHLVGIVSPVTDNTAYFIKNDFGLSTLKQG